MTKNKVGANSLSVIFCVLPIRDGERWVDTLQRKLKFQREPNVMSHDARIVVPVVTVALSCAIQMLSYELIDANE
jgi:hypothetical protein